jgi:hypothetical protein
MSVLYWLNAIAIGLRYAELIEIDFLYTVLNSVIRLIEIAI